MFLSSTREERIARGYPVSRGNSRLQWVRVSVNFVSTMKMLFFFALFSFFFSIIRTRDIDTRCAGCLLCAPMKSLTQDGARGGEKKRQRGKSKKKVGARGILHPRDSTICHVAPTKSSIHLPFMSVSAVFTPTSRKEGVLRNSARS